MTFKELRKSLLKHNLLLKHRSIGAEHHNYIIVWKANDIVVATTTAEFAPPEHRHINPNFEYEDNVPECVINRLKEVQTTMLLSTV